MIFGVARLVSFISRFMSLHPGDIISTGTPPGIGMGQKPEPIYLRAGQPGPARASKGSANSTSACGSRLEIFEDFAALRSSRRGRRLRNRDVFPRHTCRARNWRPIARPTQQRTHREQLVERELSVKDVTARQTVCRFQIDRRDDLPVQDQRRQVRRVGRERGDRRRRQRVQTAALPSSVPRRRYGAYCAVIDIT